MHLSFGASIKEIPGPDLTIDCLWCGKNRIVGHTRERTEWLKLFHLIPVFRLRTVFLQCNECGQDMIAKTSLNDLPTCNLLTLKYQLVRPSFLAEKLFLLLGIVLCWFPVVGFPFAAVGYFYGRKLKGKYHVAALIALVVALLSTLICFIHLLVTGEVFLRP
jgi:hypothetical protein